MLNSKALALILFVSYLIPQTVFAAGLEKTVTWSGRYAGIAGAAVSSVVGGESLYFNPAGLAGTQGTEVSGNFTAIFPQFQGPLQPGNPTQQFTGDRSFKPSFGVFVSHTFENKISIGAGAYAAGGTKAVFSNIDLTNGAIAGYNYNIKSDLSLVEYSLGAAYEILDGLRVGAAYRILTVSGSIGTIVKVPALGASGAAGATYDGLSATNYNGIRLGAEYSPKDAHWGIGAMYRNEVDFSANGTMTAAIFAPGSPTTGPAPVNVTNALPYELALAGHYDITPDVLRVFLEYDFINYNVDQTVGVSGSTTGPAALGSPAVNGANIAQGWNNESIIRIGGQYVLNPSWVFRVGYAYTSQVTPSSDPNSTFTPPGIGTTLLLGAGWNVCPSTSIDGAIEYSFVSGTGNGNATPFSSGSFSANDYSFHTGATYRF